MTRFLQERDPVNLWPHIKAFEVHNALTKFVEIALRFCHFPHWTIYAPGGLLAASAALTLMMRSRKTFIPDSQPQRPPANDLVFVYQASGEVSFYSKAECTVCGQPSDAILVIKGSRYRARVNPMQLIETPRGKGIVLMQVREGAAYPVRFGADPVEMMNAVPSGKYEIELLGVSSLGNSRKLLWTLTICDGVPPAWKPR